MVLPCLFEVLICFDDLPAAFDPDFEIRAPGILPIRASPASTSSHARSAADSGILPRDVDMVFLTGGSSFVPAVRRIFERRFEEKRIRGGDEFTSVARGLALKAMDSHVSRLG
jgi:hypothetical protein